jgi:hypothetical protein
LDVAGFDRRKRDVPKSLFSGEASMAIEQSTPRSVRAEGAEESDGRVKQSGLSFALMTNEASAWRPPWIWAAAGLLICFASCGRHEVAPPETRSIARPGDASGAGEDRLAAALSELTQAVRKYSVEQRKAPKTLDELVATGYLTNPPPAPPGKRFAIDKDLRVFVTDR